MKCKECGDNLVPYSRSDYCRKCRARILRERAERIAELPWYIFDREDPTTAVLSSVNARSRPVDDVHTIHMSKRKFTM